MLWTVIALLLVFWVVGLALKVATGVIHLLLVIVIALVIFNMVTGRRSRA